MSKNQVQRQANVEHVIGDMRLEGLKPSKFGEQLFQSYVKGEMTIDEVQLAIHKHYNKNFQYANVA